MRLLITGGAGFIGSNLALMFANRPGWRVITFDNLRRRGSELALARLQGRGIAFIHGDVRNFEDLEQLPAVDLLVECSAEPSVHAGYEGDVRYLVNTNLLGAFNCLEYARRHGTAVVFLSTSRVYSIPALRSLPLQVAGKRFVLEKGSAGPGWSEHGITEDFPTGGARSLYGTTKLASELLIEEYSAAYGLCAIVNRCGVIAGPWQMGKVDQGFFTLWAARHLYKRPLRYIGFGGKGHQIRDVLHIADLYALIERQIDGFDQHRGQVYNVGGGRELSVSLAELTDLCAARTQAQPRLDCDPATRPADIPYYITDCDKVSRATGWQPAWSVAMILDEVLDWLDHHRGVLETILA
jgi:CDP-paratose 2-epimerase